MIGTEGRRIFGGTGLGLGLTLLALAGVPSCGGVEESLVSPCESELQCGQPCSPSMACDSGQHCGQNKTCTAECIPGDSRCGSGRRCNGSGLCVEGLSIGLGGSSSGGGGISNGTGGTSVCADVNITLDKQIPTVLLLVDQSASMTEDFGDSDRWQVLRTSLMDQTNGIVSTLQEQVRFGLALYSGRNNQLPCPIITPVAPALNNYAAIDAAYPVPTDAVIDDTPTGESIDVASMMLQQVQELGQKVIVLATDGEPDTCDQPDPNEPEAQEVSIEAAQAAFGAGVFTFIISVGDEISDNHLREMANVGQGYPRNDMTNRFYRANNQAELAAAFATIVEGVRSCAFALNGTVNPGGEALGTVELNDAPLVLNDANGWRLSSPTTIELVGAACDTVKNSPDVRLEASFPCNAITPNVPK